MEVEYHEEYVRNSRGVQLFTCGWLPAKTLPKALVFLCHGYAMECSGYMRECGMRLAAAGYGVFGMDYEGHGKSMGARCYIRSFRRLVDDCHRFFKSICGKQQNLYPFFITSLFNLSAYFTFSYTISVHYQARLCLCVAMQCFNLAAVYCTSVLALVMT
uniref:Serine aminopeptidase S33 domain-containing protein n=1 Tax=Oryza nivara TaxID=4536 RepID=A0A0E0FKZ1_ORYNI